MTVTRPEQGPPHLRSPYALNPRVVVSALPGTPFAITVDVCDDPKSNARVQIGGQSIAAPPQVLQALYAVLHGIYGAGSLV